MTKKKRDVYLKDPSSCLACGSHSLGAEDFETGSSGTVTRECFCEDCGYRWKEVYEITDVVGPD